MMDDVSTIKPRLELDERYVPLSMIVTKEEAQNLLDYFMNVGYIGYELKHDLTAHKFIKKLEEFLK